MLEMQRSPLDPPSANNQAQGHAKEHGHVDISGAAIPGKTEKKKKPNNGWTSSLETLVAEWADKANCYRWMHDKSSGKFGTSNLWFTFPVIIFSTVTGTASFGINGLLPDEGNYSKYAGAAIGIVSLLTALIQTISNTLRYAQQSEAHRVAAISWGKFQRFISIELSLHPDERMDAMNFLKMGRIELDRLIEQSPSIPNGIIRQFEIEFRKKTNIKRPEIAGGMEHTRVFQDRDSRMVRLAAEAALMLSHKKKLMSELVLEDIDKRIAQKTKEERTEIESELRAELERIKTQNIVVYNPPSFNKSPTQNEILPETITLDISPPNLSKKSQQATPLSSEQFEKL
jgi:hypothetical protein